MTETSSSAHDLQCTDVLMQLVENETSHDPGAACTPVPDSKFSGLASRIAQLEAELATEQRRTQELQEQLASCNSPGATKTTTANPFDMMLTLSSEREAALRERKLYKNRAADAEANVAQLESDLAAAHATAKLQTEHANKVAARCDELQRRVTALESDKLGGEHQQAQLPANHSADSTEHAAASGGDEVASLRRLLQERNKTILELEMQLTDRAGAPTMFGGELERALAGAFPSVVYALESLDTPGEIYKLTRPVNTVGRGKTNDIALDSASVSRFHARLLNKPDGVWLVDLQSINGCHVNDRPTSMQVLNEGDLVVIGHCRFRFSAVKPHR